MIPATVSDITTILSNSNITFTVDKTSKAICHVRLSQQVVVLKCRQAFRDYDQEHPERILCILVNSNNYLVIVLNRDLDHDVMIRSWWNRCEALRDGTPTRPIDCVICFESMSNGGSFTSCCHCGAVVCGDCFMRMNGQAADSDEACSYKCAVCRTWKLHGSSFGVPSVSATYPQQNFQPSKPDSCSAVDRFINILSKLDGLVEIIPRVNREFNIVTSPLRICKLSFTDRYSFFNEAIRIKKVRKFLTRLVNTLNDAEEDELLLYVLRSTYAIDKAGDKPVTEISVLQIKGKTLQAYSNEAYINVFDETSTIYIQVELAQPTRHLLPNTLLHIFADISKEYAYPITMSVLSYPNSTNENDGALLGVNFDMDAQGRITTVHHDLLAFSVYNLLHCRKASHKCLATVRVHRYGDDKSDFVAFEFDDLMYSRIGRNRSKNFWKADYDDLKGSRRIVEFC